MNLFKPHGLLKPVSNPHQIAKNTRQTALLLTEKSINESEDKGKKRLSDLHPII